MKRNSLILSTINNVHKNELVRFFKVDQYIKLSHWARNVWVRILRISLFGEIPENVATDIIGHEMIGPCTMAIAHDNVHTWLVIADKIGVSKIDLKALSVLQLERLAGMLNGRIFPHDCEPNDRVKARQELLQGEIEAMDDESSMFYLAGL